MTETLRIIWVFLEKPWFIGDDEMEKVRKSEGKQAISDNDQKKPSSWPTTFF